MTDKCPKCEGELVAKKGKYGDFFGCTYYPSCKYTTKARASKMKHTPVFKDNAQGSYGSRNN